MLRLPLLFILFASLFQLRPAPATNPDWNRPFAPVRIVGNLYYVGTYDLSSYLLTSDQGHILINTGLTESVPLIRANIESLGFKLADVKLLLATHAHWDHVAGMAALKKLTGARMAIHEGDAALMRDGGRSDFRFGGPEPSFEPVVVDQALKDGAVLTMGTNRVTLHHHPGHTKGASSYTMTIREAGRDYRVVIANMGSINDGVTLLKNARYPSIADDYARTFREQKALPIDIFLASHASQFRLHDKFTPGDAYDPNRFVDPQGFRAGVERLEKLYLDQLARERASN